MIRSNINTAEIEGILKEEIIRLMLENPNIPLNEGLVRSMGAENFAKLLSAKFGIDEDDINFEPFINRIPVNTLGQLVSIKMPINSDKQVFGGLKHFLNICGYFYVKQVQINSEEKIVYFEAKYPKDATEQVRGKCTRLFHITPKIYLDKILKNGLIPKSKNNEYSYPERIFLMAGDELSNSQENVLANIIGTRGMSLPMDNNEYAILIIDLHKVPSNIKFYIDPTAPHALYTYDNIPPQAIIKYKDYEPYITSA